MLLLLCTEKILIFAKSEKCLIFSRWYGIIYEQDCTRYALKREVAAFYAGFPWSMSDFKPGERIFDVMVKDQSAFKQIMS